MKRVSLGALMLGGAMLLNISSASAEGYQVNTLSAKQLGMAHTGVSQKLSSESLWFNPAASAYQEGLLSTSAGTTLIAATADWANGTDSHTTDNKLSTPIYANVNFKIGKNLGLGVLFNTPYGSSLNWGSDWAGAHMVQSISLQAYNLQPTVSYKLFNGRLSLGAGLMMSWGNFELSKALLSGDELAALDASALGSVPVSGTLGGDAKLALGYNVGVMVDACDMVTIGASYRSKMMMKVEEGATEIAYSSDAAAAALGSRLDPMATTTFSAEMPLPAVWSLGITVRPTEKLEIAAEAQLTEWSAYESLSLTMNDDALSAYDQNFTKNYSDSFAARFGMQYDLGRFLAIRAGVYYDQSPVADDYLNPETPSMDKMGYTAGLSIRPFSKMSIDLSYGFLHGIGGARAGSCAYKEGLPNFSGEYTTKAHMASVGLSFGF